MPRPWQGRADWFALAALAVLVTAASFGARWLWLPDVSALTDRERPTWQVELAFLLDSLSNVGLAGIAVLMVLALVSATRNRGP